MYICDVKKRTRLGLNTKSLNWLKQKVLVFPKGYNQLERKILFPLMKTLPEYRK